MRVYSKEPPRCSQCGPVSPSMRWPLAAGPGGSTLVTRRSKKLPQPEMLVSSFHTMLTGASTIAVGQARYVGVVIGKREFRGAVRLTCEYADRIAAYPAYYLTKTAPLAGGKK